MMVFWFLMIVVSTNGSVTPDPIPAAAAVVETDLARVTMLGQGLIRVQTKEIEDLISPWDDRATLQVINRRLSVPQYHNTTAASSISVTTSVLTFVVDPVKKIAKCSCHNNNYQWSWEKGPPTPSFLTLINSEGMYLMEDTNTTRLTHDTLLPWLDHIRTKQTDFYFFCYGTDFLSGLQMLSDITGKAPLMPHAAYGVWWCQCCPAYTPTLFDQEVLEMYKNLSLPLTVVVLDMDWHTDGWNHYTWDPKLFPDPVQFVASLHDGTNGYNKSLKLSLNIHPGAYEIAPDNEANYAAFANAMGVKPDTGKKFKCNLYNKTYAIALITTMLDATGVDYYWDDCYKCTWKIQGHSGADGGSCGDDISVGVDGNLWSNYVFNAYRQTTKKVRPLSLNRLPGLAPSNAVYTLLTNPKLTTTAALGGHRYPAAWTGDINGDFNTLQAHIKLFPQAAATMLWVYYSADLGGFHGTKNESYVRWLQWGVFTPIFRTHGSSDNEKRMWKFSTFPQLADAMRLRNTIGPWLYTLAYITYQHSRPFIRPMWFDNPELMPSKKNFTCNDFRKGYDAGSGAQRSSTYPSGLLVHNQSQCCNICVTDPDCSAWIYATDGPVSGAGCDSCNCWPMADVPQVRESSNRVLGGLQIHPDQYLDQFYFGQAVIHPIAQAVDVATNTTTVTTFLPANDRKWVRWDCKNESFSGPINITAEYGLAEIPIYLPAGTLLPFKNLQSTESAFANPLIWVMFKPSPTGKSSTGAFSVYEDDGNSLDYLSDKNYAWTNASFHYTSTRTIVFTAKFLVGSFDGIPKTREHWLQLRGLPSYPTSVLCNSYPIHGPSSTEGTGLWWICGTSITEVNASLSCTEGSITIGCQPTANNAPTTVSISF